MLLIFELKAGLVFRNEHRGQWAGGKGPDVAQAPLVFTDYWLLSDQVFPWEHESALWLTGEPRPPKSVHK